MNTINFNLAFSEAATENNFDELIVVLGMAQKAVKNERDRIVKDDESAEKFAAAVTKVSALSKQLADNPDLIDDYLLAASEMKRANTTKNARTEKSIPQWESIQECMNKADQMVFDMTTAVDDTLAVAA